MKRAKKVLTYKIFENIIKLILQKEKDIEKYKEIWAK